MTESLNSMQMGKSSARSASRGTRRDSLAIGRDGKIYVADVLNWRFQVYVPTGSRRCTYLREECFGTAWQARGGPLERACQRTEPDESGCLRELTSDWNCSKGTCPVTRLHVQVTAAKRGEDNFRIADYPPRKRSKQSVVRVMAIYQQSRRVQGNGAKRQQRILAPALRESRR
jgi:hypothetical protein